MFRRSVVAAAASFWALGCFVGGCSSSDRSSDGANEDQLGAQAAPPATCYSVLRSDVAPMAIDEWGLVWLSTDDPTHTNATFSVQSVGLEGGQGAPASSPRAPDPDSEGAATVTLDHDNIYVSTAKHVWNLAKNDQSNKAPGVLFELDSVRGLGTTRDLAPGGAAVDDARLYLSIVRHGDEPTAPGEHVLVGLPKQRTASADAGADASASASADAGTSASANGPLFFDLGDRANAPPPPAGVARGSAPLFVDGDRIYLTLPTGNLTWKKDGSDSKEFFPLADGQLFRPTFLLSDDAFVYAHGVVTKNQPGDGIPAIVRQPKAGGPAEILRQEPGVSFLAMAIDDKAIYLLEQRLGIRPSKRVSRMLKKGGDAPPLVEYDGPLGTNADGALSGSHHMLVSSGSVYWDDDALAKVPVTGCGSTTADAGHEAGSTPRPPDPAPPPPDPGNDDAPPAAAPARASSSSAAAASPAHRDKACSFAPPASNGPSPAWLGLAVAALFARPRRRPRREA